MITTVLQPAFLPWLGYLSMIKLSHTFVLYDDVQFFRWFVNRNKLKVDGKEKWLTVPVSSHRDLINQTKISYGTDWMGQHLETIRHAYSRAENFKEGFDLARDIYRKFDTISELAVHSVKTICDYLGLKTKLVLSSDLAVADTGKTSRLIDICRATGGNVYLTGYGSADYIDPGMFEKEGMRMLFFKYEEQPRRQIGGTFVPFLSSIDAVMNCPREEVLSLLSMRPVLKVQPDLTS